ncbi:hypothetical protein pb186bvf_005361 [Paramecium bursaria]
MNSQIFTTGIILEESNYNSIQIQKMSNIIYQWSITQISIRHYQLIMRCKRFSLIQIIQRPQRKLAQQINQNLRICDRLSYLFLSAFECLSFNQRSRIGLKENIMMSQKIESLEQIKEEQIKYLQNEISEYKHKLQQLNEQVPRLRNYIMKKNRSLNCLKIYQRKRKASIYIYTNQYMGITFHYKRLPIMMGNERSSKTIYQKQELL